MNEQLPTELTEWATRIAMEVEPEREALAPMMMAAYLRGGRERSQLFESTPTLGGFLPDGGISLLPYAFLALTKVAAGLMKIYDSGGLGVVTDLLRAWKTWLEVVRERKPITQQNSTRGPAESLISLRRVLEEIQGTLQTQGLPQEQCELVSYRVMKTLLQRPAEAAQFIETFGTELA
jgi:hypothetical protein